MARVDLGVWRRLWAEMEPHEREAIQAKARWEAITLTHVCREWPDLIPKRLRKAARGLFPVTDKA